MMEKLCFYIFVIGYVSVASNAYPLQQNENAESIPAPTNTEDFYNRVCTKLVSDINADYLRKSHDNLMKDVQFIMDLCAPERLQLGSILRLLSIINRTKNPALGNTEQSTSTQMTTENAQTTTITSSSSASTKTSTANTPAITTTSLPSASTKTSTENTPTTTIISSPSASTKTSTENAPATTITSSPSASTQRTTENTPTTSITASSTSKTFTPKLTTTYSPSTTLFEKTSTMSTENTPTITSSTIPQVSVITTPLDKKDFANKLETLIKWFQKYIENSKNEGKLDMITTSSLSLTTRVSNEVTTKAKTALPSSTSESSTSTSPSASTSSSASTSQPASTSESTTTGITTNHATPSVPKTTWHSPSPSTPSIQVTSERPATTQPTDSSSTSAHAVTLNNVEQELLYLEQIVQNLRLTTTESPTTLSSTTARVTRQSQKAPIEKALQCLRGFKRNIGEQKFELTSEFKKCMSI